MEQILLTKEELNQVTGYSDLNEYGVKQFGGVAKAQLKKVLNMISGFGGGHQSDAVNVGHIRDFTEQIKKELE